MSDDRIPLRFLEDRQIVPFGSRTRKCRAAVIKKSIRPSTNIALARRSDDLFPNALGMARVKTLRSILTASIYRSRELIN